MKRSLCSFLTLSAVLLVAPRAARAAAILIDDTAADETITIRANDFEFGFYVNGALIQIGLNNPGSVTFPETGPVILTGVWIDLGQTVPVFRTIYLVEPSDPTLISDIFTYSVSTHGDLGTIIAIFQSDINEGGLGFLPPGVDPHDVFIEDGTPVPFSAAFLQGAILSDVEVVVPEPTTLCLLGFGLSGLGFMARRRQRR